MGTARRPGLMAVGMKVIGVTGSLTELVKLFIQMAIDTVASLSTVKPLDAVAKSMLMGFIMLAFGQIICRTDQAKRNM